MTSFRASLIAGVCGAVLLLPGLAAANSVTFRNECNYAVVVQSASLVRGVMVRDRPVTLRFGEVSPKLRLDADKVITVYDSRNPTRILFQGSLKASPREQYFSIEPEAGGTPKARMTPRPGPRGDGPGGP